MCERSHNDTIGLNVAGLSETTEEAGITVPGRVTASNIRGVKEKMPKAGARDGLWLGCGEDHLYTEHNARQSVDKAAGDLYDDTKKQEDNSTSPSHLPLPPSPHYHLVFDDSASSPRLIMDPTDCNGMQEGWVTSESTVRRHTSSEVKKVRSTRLPSPATMTRGSCSPARLAARCEEKSRERRHAREKNWEREVRRRNKYDAAMKKKKGAGNNGKKVFKAASLDRFCAGDVATPYPHCLASSSSDDEEKYFFSNGPGVCGC